MKPSYRTLLTGLFLVLSACTHIQAQSIGFRASAVWLTDCNQSSFFNTSGNAADLIGPASNAFNNSNLGAFTHNSGSLILRGAQVKTFKDQTGSNVCGARLFYRVYLQSATPGAFNMIDLPFLEDCNVPTNSFPSGGPCTAGDQKWQRVITDGTTTPYSPVNLTTLPAGNYTLELYFELTGSTTATTGCAETIALNNGGGNYKAFFSIQSPNVTSVNPSSCFGNEGSITIGGLTPGTSYQFSYSDDGVGVPPATYVANAAGQITVTGLNKGFYSDFILLVNGCSTNLFTGVILSDPIFVPTFNPIPPFCSGGTAPSLPTTSNNGLGGTWNPSAIDNQASGTYTFTPNANQCGIPVTLNVTVIPRAVPVFSFGTSLTICGDAPVPTLPTVSSNGISGSWSPSVVSSQSSGTYTFTPNSAECASPATLTVTVNPNITPTFPFGTSLSICTGEDVPSLSSPSANGITGTWTPSSVSNQVSGAYTFTPDAAQCAIPLTFNVTVSPLVDPVFDLASSFICEGATVLPTLPPMSNNGVAGTWNPSTVSNQSTATYVFTPTVTGPCVKTFSFTLTITPPVRPTFDIGTSQSVCVGSVAPVLPAASNNGITGSWMPAVVDNQHSGTYTFTPAAGQCATTVSFEYEVNPIPTVTLVNDTTVYDGDLLPPHHFTGTSGSVINWTNDNPSIGLAASGTGPLPSFTATNPGTTPLIGNVTVIPRINGCIGTAETYKITVMPLIKDVFIPNVFSPNGDGKNDFLYVYGNYVDKVDMRIFNQWGEHIATISRKTEGWDGKHKGHPQPVGVYMYVANIGLTNGKTVVMKGSITLVR